MMSTVETDSPASAFLNANGKSANWALAIAWLQNVGGVILAASIGSGAIAPEWGWLALALVLQGSASRMYDMLWRIWVETVPPEDLARRTRSLR